MNVFGDLARPITQRPGDPRDRMSYGDAMALRDRHRSGQPVDKDKLAEADKIVKETRAKVFTPTEEDERQDVQERPETAGPAGAAQNSRSDSNMQPQPKEAVCEVTGAPGSFMAEMIAKTAEAQAAKQYHPKAGSIPWKLYRHLKDHPGKAMSRTEIAAEFGCPVNGIDATLDLAVSREAFKKARNSKMELTWGLGPSRNVVIDDELVIPKFSGRVEPALKLVAPVPVLADASIPEGRSTTSGVSSPASTPEESSSAAAAQPAQSDSIAAQPCAESLNSAASVAPAQVEVALERPASEVSAALTRQQSEVAVAPPRPELVVAAQSTANAESLELLGSALDPVILTGCIERNLWSESDALEKRWVAFFDAFEIGDHIEVDDDMTPELSAWRSFYREKTWEYADGVRLFTIYPKREGVYGMVRVL